MILSKLVFCSKMQIEPFLCYFLSKHCQFASEIWISNHQNCCQFKDLMIILQQQQKVNSLWEDFAFATKLIWGWNCADNLLFHLLIFLQSFYDSITWIMTGIIVIPHNYYLSSYPSAYQQLLCVNIIMIIFQAPCIISALSHGVTVLNLGHSIFITSLPPVSERDT